ncbi:alpha/beta-hydrolase, partial [Westerdykella ornata]
ATPTPRDASDSSTDMDDVIAGRTPCAPNAVIFGRGTFDTGNLGVWVGPFLKDGLLKEFNGRVHVQGVNPEDYPAELPGYVEGGSETCANACAKTIDDYAVACPNANIFISGWSQGALCARKCVNRVGDAGKARLKAMATFGDESALMDSPQPVPAGLPFKLFCVEDTAAPDVLCTSTLTSGIHLPTSVDEFNEVMNQAFTQLKAIASNPGQTAAVLKLPVQLASGLLDSGVFKAFMKDLLTGKVRRWLVLPPHFKYGNNGDAAKAAAWLA